MLLSLPENGRSQFCLGILYTLIGDSTWPKNKIFQENFEKIDNSKENKINIMSMLSSRNIN